MINKLNMGQFTNSDLDYCKILSKLSSGTLVNPEIPCLLKNDKMKVMLSF